MSPWAIVKTVWSGDILLAFLVFCFLFYLQISYNVSKMASGLGPTKFNGTLNILTTFRENN
jgi:hypothetical protein